MFDEKNNITDKDNDDQISKQSFGRKKRQTIGELAELVEKYDNVRNQVLRKRVNSKLIVGTEREEGNF